MCLRDVTGDSYVFLSFISVFIFGAALNIKEVRNRYRIFF